MNNHEASYLVIPVSLSLPRIQQATMSTMSVLISVGAVLRTINLVQLVFMTLMEVIVFGTMRMLFRECFSVSHGVVRRGEKVEAEGATFIW